MHAIELALIGARADAELQSSAGQEIGHCRFACQLDRMPIGGNSHRRAETNRACMSAPPGEDLERVRRYRHLQRMMLSSPDRS